MKPHSGSTQPIWAATVELPQLAALDRSLRADVCVVGGGIAGLTTAYLLAHEGAKVVVIDDGLFCGGETGRTTAHLASYIDDSYQQIERLHGQEGARLAFESHSAAIDAIERIVRQENIACDFVRLDGHLFEPAGEKSDFIDN